MCGKMELSFFRPLQIAIAIQVLASTVLCVPPDASDDKRCWVEFSGWQVLNEKEISVKDLGDCQTQCSQNPDCVSIDFNPGSNGCWLLKAKENNKKTDGKEHYDYKCPKPGTANPPPDSNRCWVEFFGWEILGGNAIEAKNLGDCQAQCVQNTDCVSIDYHPGSKGGCWLLKTKASNTKIDGKEHYDYICPKPGAANPPPDSNRCWVEFTGWQFLNQNEIVVKDAVECQAECLQKPDCESIDFAPYSNGCYLLKTRDSNTKRLGNEHYDYKCLKPGAANPPPDSNRCWVELAGWDILGGDAIEEKNLGDCQAKCFQHPDCVSIEFNPGSNGCWLLKKIPEGSPKTGWTEHYDYICPRGTQKKS